jgi:hypothetical protein
LLPLGVVDVTKQVVCQLFPALRWPGRRPSHKWQWLINKRACSGYGLPGIFIATGSINIDTRHQAEVGAPMITILAPKDCMITEENPEQSSKLFTGDVSARSPATDLTDLTVDVDLSAERTLWLVHDLADVDELEQIFLKVTECSKVILVLPPSHDKSIGGIEAQARVQDLLQQKRLAIVLSAPVEQQVFALARLIDIDTYDSWKPLLSQSFLRANSEYIQSLYRQLATYINVKTLMKSTALQKGVSFLRNALINAPMVSGRLQISAYKDILKDRPAIVVSAGPSLNKQMEMLAANKDLFTIFAVDRVWPILKKHGITPDVVVSLDPNSKPSWPENGLDPETTFMVDLGSSPELVWSHNSNHVFTSCNEEVNALLNELGAVAEPMSTGGSVATTAMSLALHMGANPIVLIGQDLALTGGKAYAEGYMYKPADAYLKQQYESGFDIVGYNGETVRTDRQLLFYKTWFENRIKALPPESMIINSTEGGACIAGALQIPFAAVCEEIRATALPPKQQLSPVMPTVPDEEYLQILIANVEKLVEKIKALHDIAKKGKSIARSKAKQTQDQRLKKIDKINHQILHYDPSAKYVVDVFGMVKLEAIRYGVVVGKDLEVLSDAVKKYAEVYDSVMESCDLSVAMMYKLIECYKSVLNQKNMDYSLIEKMTGVQHGKP